jgi:hypothetical protein
MPSCKKVKVDMENRLTGSGIGVVDDPKTFLCHSVFPGKPGSGLEDVTDQSVIFWHESERTDNVFSRHDEKVHGRNRRDVLYGNHQFILIDLLGRDLIPDYFAEDATIHCFPSLLLHYPYHIYIFATIHHLHSRYNPRG